MTLTISFNSKLLLFFIVYLFIYLAIVLGILVRFLVAFGPLGLDELWSLDLVSKVGSISAVFNIKHDNSHPLNSLWLWTLGPNCAPILYRLPSLIASVITILALAMTTRARREQRYIIWAALISLSYPLIVLGAEARGYSVMIMTAALSFLWMTRNQFRTSASDIFITTLLGAIGILSHASFIMFSLAFLRLATIPSLLVQLGIINWLYLDMEIGGGPQQSQIENFLNFWCSLFFGQVLSLQNIPLSALMFVNALVGACFVSYRAIRERLFLPLIVPIIFVLVASPPVLQPRYFSIAALFSLFLLARFSLSVPLLATLQILSSYQLLTFGRVDLRPALVELSGQTLGTNQAFQLDIMLRGEGLNFQIGQECSSEYLIYSHEAAETINATPCDQRYKLISIVRAPPLTGPSWLLYKKVFR